MTTAAAMFLARRTLTLLPARLMTLLSSLRTPTLRMTGAAVNDWLRREIVARWACFRSRARRV